MLAIYYYIANMSETKKSGTPILDKLGKEWKERFWENEKRKKEGLPPLEEGPVTIEISKDVRERSWLIESRMKKGLPLKNEDDPVTMLDLMEREIRDDYRAKIEKRENKKYDAPVSKWGLIGYGLFAALTIGVGLFGSRCST